MNTQEAAKPIPTTKKTNVFRAPEGRPDHRTMVAVEGPHEITKAMRLFDPLNDAPDAHDKWVAECMVHAVTNRWQFVIYNQDRDHTRNIHLYLEERMRALCPHRKPKIAVQW